MFNEEENFNKKPIKFGKIFYRVLNYWYYLVFFLVLSLIVAFFTYKSTPDQYKISARLLIKNNQDRMTTIGTDETALPGISLGAINNLENQLIILSSSGQVEKTLNQLDFTISYFKVGSFKETEIYKQSPFKVKLDTSGVNLYKAKYIIEFTSPSDFNLYKEDEGNFLGRHKFFEKITIDGINLIILPNKIDNNHLLKNKSFSFQINPLNELIKYYQNEISTSDINPGASIFDISINANNIQKGKDFINKLAENSVEYTLEKKNQIANNTIRFIEDQLINIGDSLNRTKNMLENFRSRNEMVDISLQGQMIIDRTESLELEKNIITRQLDYYQYLVNFLENNQNILNLLPPSAKGIENIAMDQMISELATLNAEKQSLQFNSKESNPAITRINRLIDAQKQTILQQAKSNVASTQNDLNDVNKRLVQLGQEIRKLPKKEQVSMDIEQKFQTTDQLHTYLMERRSEAQLAKASNVPDNEIIEKAQVIKKTKPNITSFVIIVLVIGIIIPSLILFFIIFMNNKVQDKDDLEDISSLPIIGVTPTVQGRPIITPDNSKSSFSESTRNIRTALSFFPSQNDSKCILITSGLPGEGKSSNALNLAISYAQLGKKTIIADFDMRKPMIGNILNIPKNGLGLSTFLAENETTETNNLIHSSDEHQVDVIPSGSIPPNPAELIGSQKTESLIKKLRELYDVIIIDSPPIGLVTDALLLSKMTDINIIVVRHNKTPIPMLKNLLKDYKIKSIKNLCLLLNGLPIKKRAYNNYTYSDKYYK